MLNVNTDTIFRLIDLAKEFHAQEEVNIPDETGNSSADWAMQVLASHADDATQLEFNSIINDLEPDQQQEVVALFWVGRGDFMPTEWKSALRQARDDWNHHTGEYLIAHALLADYLREGLELLGYEFE